MVEKIRGEKRFHLTYDLGTTGEKYNSYLFTYWENFAIYIINKCLIYKWLVYRIYKK